VRYSKVSFPTAGPLEKQLAADQRIDVYGIYFDVNTDRLRRESDPVLQEIAGALERNPQWQLTIDGHTDSVGTAEANMNLSQRRSEAVRAALVDRFGIVTGRLTTRGYGATVPKAADDTPQGRAQNRRVELVRHSRARFSHPCSSRPWSLVLSAARRESRLGHSRHGDGRRTVHKRADVARRRPKFASTATQRLT